MVQPVRQYVRWVPKHKGTFTTLCVSAGRNFEIWWASCLKLLKFPGWFQTLRTSSHSATLSSPADWRRSSRWHSARRWRPPWCAAWCPGRSWAAGWATDPQRRPPGSLARTRQWSWNEGGERKQCRNTVKYNVFDEVPSLLNTCTYWNL